MLSKSQQSYRLSLTICVTLLAAFWLTIANWRSSLALRTYWSNADLLIFLLLVTLFPIVLLRQAKRLPTRTRTVFSVLAFCGLAFACMAWFFNVGMILGMAKGWAYEPLLVSVPYRSGRIAAYQVETTPAGAYVALRLQYPAFPGVLVSREFAAIDAPYVDALTVAPAGDLCVRITKTQTDLRGQHSEFGGVLVPIGPLLTWTPRTMIEAEDTDDRASCQQRALQ